MLTRNMPREMNWRCHLFYQTRSGEKEEVFYVTARHEDEALTVAERLLRLRPARVHVPINYMEAVQYD